MSLSNQSIVIWRYMPFNKFKHLLEKKKLYMPNAYAYEDTDINEGRISQTYVDTLERGLGIKEKLHLLKNPIKIKNAKRHVRDELKLICASIKATRANSYISCWTARDYEEQKMWNSFAGGGDGIAIMSTVFLVAEQIFEGCESLDQSFMLTDDKITYDRQSSHHRLDLENINDLTLPLFTLEAGAESYSHEKEYRFVVIDQEGRATEQDKFALQSPRGNIVSGKRLKVRRRKHFRHRFIQLPVDCEKMILEVRVHPRASGQFMNNVVKLVQNAGLTCNLSKSEL